MRVVDFLHEVGDRQLQLMQPETACLVTGSELQARTQIK